MNRNEQQMYSDITSIRKSLEKIANALEKNNKKEIVKDIPLTVTNEIPGFEGVLNDLDNLYVPKDKDFEDYHANLGKLNNNPPLHKDEYVDTTNGKIKNDSDHDIRSTAAYYEEALLSVRHRDLKTKKDCIFDYVTNEFGLFGARYTDIIKFCYYLGAPNAPKYTSANRGYYSCAFATRFGGHLVQGGKDQLVKGINCDGKERYYALSYVDNATDYYKRIL